MKKCWRIWKSTVSTWTGCIPDSPRSLWQEVFYYVYEEESDPRYAGYRPDACISRRVIPANNIHNNRGLLTIRRPIPNTNLIFGGIWSCPWRETWFAVCRPSARCVHISASNIPQTICWPGDCPQPGGPRGIMQDMRYPQYVYEEKSDQEYDWAGRNAAADRHPVRIKEAPICHTYGHK